MPGQVPATKASFSVVCRSNYFKDVRPADPLSQKSPGYIELVAVAKAYFAAGQQEKFKNYLVEEKYLVNLWAAHLLLEYGQPDSTLVQECLEIIGRYAASPFDPALAEQEQHWLNAFKARQGR